MKQRNVLVLPLLALLACSDAAPESPHASADAGALPPPAAGADAAGGPVSAPPPPPPPPPVDSGLKYGTLIVLGDSISDNGGEAPFYYDLLHTNDDARYPAWKGHDFTTRYPGVTYVHGAKAGAQTALYSDQALSFWIPTLVDQVKALGSSYPGDVAIVITIGGNDLNGHAADAIQEKDENDRQQFAGFLKGVLTELTTPGRLGSGKVAIAQANVYDATGGRGDWDKGKCGPNLKVDASLDQKIFGGWNQVIADAVARTPNDRLLDLHTLFAAHGFNDAASWFMPDCLHPHAVGHAAIRREAWRLLTGETLDP